MPVGLGPQDAPDAPLWDHSQSQGGPSQHVPSTPGADSPGGLCTVEADVTASLTTPDQSTLSCDCETSGLHDVHNKGTVLIIPQSAPMDCAESIVGESAPETTIIAPCASRDEESQNVNCSSHQFLNIATNVPQDVYSVAEYTVWSDHSYLHPTSTSAESQSPESGVSVDLGSSSSSSSSSSSKGLEDRQVASRSADDAVRRVLAPSILVDFHIINSDPDGNCFYASVSRSMYGTPDAHLFLRKLTMLHAKSVFEIAVQPFAVRDLFYENDEPVLDRPFISFAEYFVERGVTNKFATSVEVCLLADALQRPIIVYQRNSGELHETQLYGNDFSAQVPVLVEFSGGAVQGGHYDVVCTPQCPSINEALPDLEMISDDAFVDVPGMDSEFQTHTPSSLPSLSFHSDDDEDFFESDQNSFDDIFKDVSIDVPHCSSGSDHSCSSSEDESDQEEMSQSVTRERSRSVSGRVQRNGRRASSDAFLGGVQEEVEQDFFTLNDHRRNPRASKSRILREHGVEPNVTSPRKQSLASTVLKGRAALRKCTQKVEALRRKLKSLRHRPDDMSHFLSNIKNDFLQNLVKMHIRNRDRKPCGRRYTLDEKLVCLSFMKTSYRAYRLLARFLHIPTKKVLFQLLAKIPLSTGINTILFTCLEPVVRDLSPSNRCCSLVFDETGLTQRFSYNANKGYVEGYKDFGPEEDGDGRTNLPATHLLVFMVQGMRKKWKQPVAYFFCNKTTRKERLYVLIKTITTKLQNLGLDVRATVCDQGSSNQGALNMLREHTRADARSQNPPGPYFLLNSTKVFVLYDVPHLFKCIRNMFLRYKLLWDNMEANFQFIRTLHEFCKQFPLFTVANLSETHLQPNTKDKMRMKMAAQTLSASVAVFLILMDGNEAMGRPQSKNTGNVIMDLDKLMDLSNGPGGRPKPFRCNVSATSPHHEEWPKMLQKLKTAKFVDDKGKSQYTPTFSNWAKSIEAARSLYHQLQDDFTDFKYLNVRQLQQDCLENFFGNVKSQLGKNCKLTAADVHSAVKTVMISETIKHSPTFNCEDDEQDLLVRLRSLLFPRGEENVSEVDPVNDISAESENVNGSHQNAVEIHLPEEDDTRFVVDEETDDLMERVINLRNQAPTYVGGYLCYRLLKIIPTPCEVCLSNLRSDDVDADHSYIQLREFDEKKRLEYPSLNMRNFVKDCEKIFVEQIANSQFHIRNLRDMTVTLLMAGTSTAWISCPQHRTLIVDTLFQILVPMMIKKQCKRLNEEQRNKERLEAALRRQRQRQPHNRRRGARAPGNRHDSGSSSDQISDPDDDL